MKNKIHSTAIIDSTVVLGEEVEIGPYSVISKNVKIGKNCKIGSHVQINHNVEIGNQCKIYSSASIGSDPQDLKYNGEETRLIIGDDTTIREFSTINRGTGEFGITLIGNNCLLMAYSHVAHDCHLKNNIILSNGVQLGGHVMIDSNVIIGGMTPVHQFCKLGEFSFVAGGYRVVQDVPPYIMAKGEPLKYSGVNSIGLRRSRFNHKDRSLIKKIYSIIYKSGLNITQAIDKINNEFDNSKHTRIILDFIDKSDRGLI